MAGPILTPPISNPQLLPFVQDLQVIGTGATPTITWTLPDLAGFDVDAIRLRVWNDAKDDAILNNLIAGTLTQFTVPSGVLLPGVPYIFAVVLQDDATNPCCGSGSENQSNTFTQSAYFVPEPGTGLLVMAGLLGLAYRQTRQRGARRMGPARSPHPSGYAANASGTRT